jgi:hypothetical protein
MLSLRQGNNPNLSVVDGNTLQRTSPNIRCGCCGCNLGNCCCAHKPK